MSHADRIVRLLVEGEGDFDAKEDLMAIPPSYRALHKLPDSARPYALKATPDFLEGVLDDKESIFYEAHSPGFDNQYWWPDPVQGRRTVIWRQYQVSNALLYTNTGRGMGLSIGLNMINVGENTDENIVDTAEWGSPHHLRIHQQYALKRYYAECADYYGMMMDTGIDPLQWVYQSEGDDPATFTRNVEIATREQERLLRLYRTVDPAVSLIWL